MPYAAINQQVRSMGRRRAHVDRREISKFRGAFDRTTGRASEPCHLSCTGCGALAPPPPLDPQRGDAARLDPCKHCGTSAWVDLSEDEATRGLATVEAYEHKTIDRRRRILHWVLRIGGAITMGLLCFFAAASSPSGIFAFLTMLVGFVSVCFFALGYGQATRVEQRSLPYRWMLPLPPSTPVAAGGTRLRGPVGPNDDDEPLRAPFTGRPCLAYRVVVRREDAPRNAVAALVAQGACDLRIEGRPVLASTVRLDLDTRPVRVEHEREAAALAYLRRHGIFDTDGPWILEEAVLEPGDEVLVQAAERGGAILRRA